MGRSKPVYLLSTAKKNYLEIQSHDRYRRFQRRTRSSSLSSRHKKTSKEDHAQSAKMEADKRCQQPAILFHPNISG
nr:hypothetical protein BaRGS_032351 [Batillaria attramentaria]